MGKLDLGATLATVFGHGEFRPGQRQVVEVLLEGRSALAIFPTGGGKSLCYQLPALLLEGLTLVISPLIALMKDQVDALLVRGVAAARLDSTLSAMELASVYRQLEECSLQLLYVAPERLANEKFVERMRGVSISLVAIDEAHCISEWGHNFRPDYLRLAKIVRKWRIPRVLALTATATPEVARDIAREFRIAREDRVVTSFHRTNLFLAITPVEAKERVAMLVDKLTSTRPFPAIVYVTLQETSETVAAHLQRAGLRARAYHAGLADDVRSEVQQAFMLGAIEIIVATIAFGMGVDKANVRSVFHFNLPKTLENYQQEIGRAGRDGLPSHCEMLACGDDVRVLENFILGDTPTRHALLELTGHFLRQGQEFSISRYDLSRSHDVKTIVLETALIYLEKAKILEPAGAFYTKFDITFTHGENRALTGHSAGRQRFLQKLLACGTKRGEWARKLTITIEEAIEVLDESREKILKNLKLLEEAGDIVLVPKGIRHRYRLLGGAAEHTPASLADWLHGLFAEREAADLTRLKSIVSLAETAQCLTARLLQHFGEKIPPCGHCANCRSPKPRKKLPQSRLTPISLEQIGVLRALIEEKQPALRSSRQLAKFLCGLQSPALQRDRLTRHDFFGMLAHLPFSDVLTQTESMLIE